MDEVEDRQPGAAVSVTGHPVVDGALDRLAELETLHLDEHAAVYDDLHRRLGSVLDGAPEGSLPEA